MKRLTATDARREWFRVLDEVLAGETVAVERKGRRVILRAEEAAQPDAEEPLPDYSALLSGDVDEADGWSWEWPGPESEVEPID
jgi:hypothetical protein